ncbi:ABC transporter ATP-binding protein [Streptococcus oricebi]|uniref:Bacitracin ABC transporter ATP-binding protein n=1 Tax=Streptococcus oricebi TaxID=1547447 RepID=A0ABS5B461_9STRE|nr:ABC transporter ATP-binding protein [Streptococcus oricebi]MBP2623595.1 bacitracin ABC transporter ATP-binding protein [Streptococcus oricebi]
MQELVIETKQVSKNYGSFQALQEVTIHVKRGSIYGLIGDNGAGKTSLLKLLAGHTFPSQGSLQILGQCREKSLNQVRKKIGCLVEEAAFFPNMTVEQNLHYYCLQKGIPDRKKVDEMLELTKIAAKRKSKGKDLSLGQKQRLGLAIALMGEPQILILDEPINGLDPSGIVEFRGLLQRLNREKNITILISSHILSELQQIATDYGFLSQGKLLEEISSQDLHEKCSNHLEFTFSDLEGFLVLLEKYFPQENYHVLADQRLLIYEPKEEIETYSKLAAQHDIYVTSMKTVQSSLEDYYLKLKEGDQ